MRKGKVKSGSSLVAVLMIFSILLIFGTMVLSLTFSVLKSSMMEDNIKKNLYFSESGINIAYGVVGVVADKAISSGNQAVSEYMNTLNGPTGIIQRELDHIKNQEPCEYPLENDQYKSRYITEDNQNNLKVNEDTVKNEQNNIFKETYMNYFLDKNIEGEDTIRVVNEVMSQDYTIKDMTEKPIIAVKDVNIDKSKNRFLSISLESSFKKKNIEKKVSAEFDISAPDYGDGYYITSNKINIKSNPIFTKAITVDKDMIIGGNCTIAGDIFVKGNNSGIDVNAEGSRIYFKNNVATAGDINIDNKDTTFNAAGNVYTSSFRTQESADTANVSINSLYANNDFSMEGNKNIIAINNFYGISDIPGSSDELAKSKSSSAILINSDDIGELEGSSLNINNKFYAMGTAYVDTYDATGKLKQYQTGESVAVRGNYKAYTYEFPTDVFSRKGFNFNSDYVNFVDSYPSADVDNTIPFQLADKYWKNAADKVSNVTKAAITMDYQDKVDYFLAYDNAIKGGDEFDQLIKLGIKLPADRINIGAVISNEAVAPDSYSLDRDEQLIRNKKTDYAGQVYYMGDTYGLSDSDLYTAYTNGTVNNSFESQINLKNSFLTQKESSTTDGKEIIYININKDNPVNYTLVGNGGIVQAGTTSIDASSGKVKGIIITNGDLYVSGDIDFTGTIIVGGNLYIESETGHSKSFTYNQNYIQKLIAYNYSCFKDIFLNDTNDPDKIFTVDVGLSVNQDINIKSNIENNLIGISKWRIQR